MIDDNLPWRGAPSFVDSGMIPQTAKNLDPAKALSGTAGGASFESHILEMEGTKAAEAPVQNGRKEFLSQSRGDEQETAAGQESDATSSSQNATSNSASSSNDDLNAPLLGGIYGNAARPFAAEIASRLDARMIPEILTKDSSLAAATSHGWQSRNISDAIVNTDDLKNFKNPTTQEGVTSNGDPMASRGLAADEVVPELSRDSLPASVTGAADSAETSGIMTKSSEPAKALSFCSPAQDGTSPNKDSQSHWKHETLEAADAMRGRFLQKGTKEAGSGDASIVLRAADGSIQAPAQSQTICLTADAKLPVENKNSEPTPTAEYSGRKERADNATANADVVTPTNMTLAQDSLSIVDDQEDVRAKGLGKEATDPSRNRMIGAHEHEKPTWQAPTSSANDVAAIATQSQDSVAASSVSDPSMRAPAIAGGAQHGEDLRNEVVNDAGTVASSARATQGSSRQNDAQRGIRSKPAGSDVVEPILAANSHAEPGNGPPDAAILTNILDMAVQAPNRGADGNSDPRADDKESVSMMQLPSAGAREQPSSVLAKDLKSSDGLAANAASADPLVAVSAEAAKIDPVPTIDAASVGLAVIGQSTSLAPPLASLLVQQVANPILAASRTLATETAKNLPAAGVVKTLDIRLVPENLGIVVVKMRLADGALQVQVEADRQGTLRLLTDNKDVLSQSIQSSGYKLDGMTLQGSSSDMGTMGGQTLQGQGHRFDSQSSPQGFGSSPGSQQQGENRMRDPSHLGKGRESMTGETSDGYAQEGNRDKRSDSIYV